MTLNLILIPKFLKDGWEVHYIGDKHGIEHEQIDKSVLDVTSIVLLQVNYVVIFMAKYIWMSLKLVGGILQSIAIVAKDSSPSSFQRVDLSQCHW